MSLLVVNIVTYNHERYVENCIRSVFKQRTDFDFTVKVTDDNSQDSTPKILHELKKEFGSRLQLIMNDHNKGMVRNITESLKDCDSEFVAVLEGDDYFIDQQKLQKQIETLSTDPTLSFCFTNGLKVDENDNELGEFYKNEFTDLQRINLREFLEKNLSVLNTTKMFRRDTLPIEFPDWYFEVHLWDWILHILQLDKGDAIYLDIMGTGFRQHEVSYIKTLNKWENYTNGIKTVNNLDKMLAYRFHYLFKNKSKLNGLISIEYFKNRKYYLWLKHLTYSLVQDPKDFLLGFRDYFWKLRH